MAPSQEWPELRIGDLRIRIPIIQGGMGVGVSMGGLAGAVARAGAAGLIATAGVGRAEADLSKNFVEANRRALQSEIRKARAGGGEGGVVGVNIMAALTNRDDLARTAVEEGADLIVSGAGLPMNLPECLDKESRTKLVPIVSSGRAVAIITRRWMARYNHLPDALVVEGPLAGGHIGFKPEQIDDPAFSLENLLVEVLAEQRKIKDRYGRTVPVIAAGGIYSGADIRRFLDLGAAGVQMGTRFVTTLECDASTAFKEAYISAGPEDITIIKSPVGLPGRAIRNEFLEAVDRGERKPFRCPFHCILTCDPEKTPYCIANALLNARNAQFRRGFAFAGANAWRATRIIPLSELFDALHREYLESDPA